MQGQKQKSFTPHLSSSAGKLKSKVHKKGMGFTLIELLVVIAVIGLLASIIAVAVNTSRKKARDAQRIASLKQIQTALELYYDDNDEYPYTGSYTYTTTANCGYNWCVLEAALSSYLPELPRDPLGLQNSYRFYYDCDNADNRQTYGLMARMEHSSNFDLVTGDGGYYNSATSGGYYEVGPQPGYCRQKYSGGSGNWWGGSSTYVCTGGN